MIGIGFYMILGALITVGVGLFAPCMVLVSLLGMVLDNVLIYETREHAVDHKKAASSKLAALKKR